MKSIRPSRRSKIGWLGMIAAGLVATRLWAGEGSPTQTNAPPATNAPAAATAPAETNAPPAAAVPAATNAPAVTNAPPAAKPPPPPLTAKQMFEGGDKSFDNWIEISAGGFGLGGNQSQFQQRRQSTTGAFGGIEDFHYQKELAKDTMLFTDGRALFDEHDYRLKLDLERDKLGYLKFSFNEFRTWYNGDGGFYPPTSAWFPLGDDALALDRGEVSFEAGLRKANIPELTFKYTHTYREGEKSSTAWGITHPAVGVTQGLSPSFYDIDEHSDIFQLDAKHHIKATDFGVGLRYETGHLNNALKIDQSPGEPVERKITDRQGTDYDLFNVHAFTETWLKKNLMFSTGFAYSDLNNDFSGSRIYGSDFDVGYVANATNGAGYTGLTGGSRLHEYVLDLNLLYKPGSSWSIVPSVRVQQEDTDANSAGSQTLGASAPVLFTANSDRSMLDVRERLDLTYTGVTNWVLYARGDWTEGSGNLTENGGLGPVAGIGVPPISRQTDDQRLFQKYSAGARWYPIRGISLDAGGYYKQNHYDYTHNLDSTLNTSGNRYPAYLTLQDFDTYDGNVRLTLRPWQKVTFVCRYEYQLSTIHTQPDPVSGVGEAESSKMTSHIIAQDISWSPWSRLILQAGFSYVLSETRNPANDVIQGLLNAQNNYWTLNLNSGLVLDDKTDLNLGYFYYRSDNYVDNSSVGVPYGAGGEEHAITAALVRRLTRNIRVTLKYGYFHYADEPSGGHLDNWAHFVYSGLQYRF